jgi:hypothetical protein
MSRNFFNYGSKYKKTTNSCLWFFYMHGLDKFIGTRKYFDCGFVLIGQYA